MRTQNVILFLAMALSCGGCRRDPESLSKMLVSRVSGHLDLDGTQSSKLEAVRAEIFKICEESREGREAVASQIAGEIRKGRIDAKAVQETLIEKKNESSRKYLPRIIEKLSDFHQSLGPTQREAIAKWLETKKGRP